MKSKPSLILKKYLAAAYALLAGIALLPTANAAAAAKPNIIVILADDLGWSDLGCYGGEIQTPNIDRLAVNGLRFSQFYNSAKCEPTRTSLLSGQYWQDAGTGIEKGITMGQAMKTANYATFAIGKWHMLGNPFNRGFDHYFGHLSGATDYFKGDSTHMLDAAPFNPPTNGTFYTTDANADFAIKFIKDSKQQNPQKPFFMYLAFNAPHAPLQALQSDIDKYSTKYRLAGWDKIRVQRFNRQKNLGLIPANSALSPRPDSVPAWNSLTDQQKDFEGLRMSIYAAMVDRMDQAIGRVLDTVKALGEESNTVVMFLSDNGANPYDRARSGTLPNRNAQWAYGLGWSNASGTPFAHYKRNMFNGGACTPFIAYWPAGLTVSNTITEQRGHIIDLMPTLMDLAQATWPQQYQGQPLAPLPGKSLVPIFKGNTRTPHAALYFQLYDHRAVIAGNMKLVSDWGRPWQLFDLSTDRTEQNDLAAQQPQTANNLKALWQTWWGDKDPDLLTASGSEPKYRSF